MRHFTPFAALLLSNALACGAAHAELIDIRWGADERFAHEGTVAPGKFIELCAKLPAGQNVRWQFASSAAVDFNLHYHVDKTVVYPTKLAAAKQADGVLATTLAQDYCWMWTNKSAAPAALSITLQRS